MAYIDSIANIRIQQPVTVNNESRSNRNASPIFCPDKIQAARTMKAIQQAKDAGDSVGGIVAFTTQGLPVGLGDPVYENSKRILLKPCSVFRPQKDSRSAPASNPARFKAQRA